MSLYEPGKYDGKPIELAQYDPAALPQIPPTPTAQPVDPFAGAKTTGSVNTGGPFAGGFGNRGMTPAQIRESRNPATGRTALPLFGGGAGMPNMDPGAAGSGSDMPFNIPNTNELFSDPAGKQLTDAIEKRRKSLEQPINDPQRDALLSLLSGLRDGPQGQNLTSVQDNARRRIDFLQQDPFTAAEEKAMRVGQLDGIERERSQAKRREADRLMRLGHDPSSGTITAALRAIDQSYDMARAKATSDLTLYSVGEKQRRGQEAIALGEMMAGLERQDRMDRVGVGTAASGVEGDAREEQEGREREELQVNGLPNELVMQRIAQSLQALGISSGGGRSIMDSLLGIGQQGMQRDAAGAAGMGQLAQLLSSIDWSKMQNAGGSGSGATPTWTAA